MRVLKLLDQLHLKHLHLHDLLLLGTDNCLLLSHFLVDVSLGLHLLSSNKLFFLKKSYSFLLFNHLILSLGVESSLVKEYVFSLLVLDLHDPLLLHFFLLAKVDGFLYLLSLYFSLLSHLIDLLLVLLLNDLIDSERLHLMLNFDLVLLFQRNDLIRTLLCLLDLLPRAHLFLLEQRDTVGE